MNIYRILKASARFLTGSMLLTGSIAYAQEPPVYQPAPQGVAPAQAVPAGAPMGDPNYYGQVDVVGSTPPPVVYAQPIIAQPAPAGVVYQPVYLRVPTYYQANWPMYCGYYNACFYPVFFVQEVWYVSVYAPWYRHYYPYGRPGFVAHVYYNPHWGGGPHGYEEPHYEHGGDHGGHHEDHYH